jgi:hypothetical protein
MDEVAPEPSRLRRVDARFLLPTFPKTAVVMHPAWREGLRQAGIEIVEPRERSTVDLVVAPASMGRAALSLGTRVVLLEGRPRPIRPLRGDSTARRYLPVPPRPNAPVIVDLADGRAAERAIAIGTHAADLPTAAKREIARALVRLGLVPPLGPVYTVHSSASTTPALVGEAARRAGVEVDGWFLLIEPGPDHKRPVFYLLSGQEGAAAVVKFSRLLDDRRKAQREARGLAAARSAGAVAASHAPHVLADFELGGHHAVVQTAILGRTVGRMASAWGLRRGRKLAQIEPVVEWLCRIARATAHRRGSLDDDLCDTIAGGWSGDVAQHLARVAAATPAVFQHGDLADGNVIVDRGAFMAIDWELASSDGYPLWDLLYLAVCALPLVDGALDGGAADREEKHVRYLNELFRGGAASSPDFFRWLRAAAEASGLGLEAVPEVVALGLRWYSTLQARLHRRGELPSGTGWAPLERFAEQSLTDADLGIAWPAWRNSIGSA